MNSPPDPGSSGSSESPPPEENNTQPTNSSTTNQFMNIAAHITHSFAIAGSSKRRLAGASSFSPMSSNRDLKSRRRGEPARHHTGGPGGMTGGPASWENSSKAAGEGKREERDLVDVALVEYLRKG